MFLPVGTPRSATPAAPLTHARDIFTLAFGGSGRYDENWSSLIGIITAIVGNVLISFALNTQRYAHIKLDREWHEEEKRRKRRSKSSTSISRLGEEGRKSTGSQAPGRNSTEQDPLLADGNGEGDANAGRMERSDTDEGSFKQKS